MRALIAFSLTMTAVICAPVKGAVPSFGTAEPIVIDGVSAAGGEYIQIVPDHSGYVVALTPAGNFRRVDFDGSSLDAGSHYLCDLANAYGGSFYFESVWTSGDQGIHGRLVPDIALTFGDGAEHRTASRMIMLREDIAGGLDTRLSGLDTASLRVQIGPGRMSYYRQFRSEYTPRSLVYTAEGALASLIHVSSSQDDLGTVVLSSQNEYSLPPEYTTGIPSSTRMDSMILGRDDERASGIGGFSALGGEIRAYALPDDSTTGTLVYDFGDLNDRTLLAAGRKGGKVAAVFALAGQVHGWSSELMGTTVLTDFPVAAESTTAAFDGNGNFHAYADNGGIATFAGGVWATHAPAPQSAGWRELADDPASMDRPHRLYLEEGVAGLDRLVYSAAEDGNWSDAVVYTAASESSEISRISLGRNRNGHAMIVFALTDGGTTTYLKMEDAAGLMSADRWRLYR
jgi:hypothetical protein